jgi:acetyl-CoA C-acetyltransferase
MQKEVFIVSAKRTGIGGFLGSLSKHTATQLGSAVIKEVFQSAGVDPVSIDSVYMGNVLSANLGQSPARQASIGAGIPYGTDCTTINKVCASGMKATMIAAQQIQSGLEHLCIAGGMESMSNAPHYIQKRTAAKLGNETLVDGLLKDGLLDAYHHYHMGNTAEQCVREFGISRQEQDEYALQSYAKAAKALKEGKFKNEIVPVSIRRNGVEGLYEADEDIEKIVPEKLPLLKPAFEPDGTITAANASNLSDGAAALLLASGEAVRKYNLTPLARILSYSDAAQAPEKFTTAPSLALPKALKLAGLSMGDIDFFEINEAYAAVIIANRKLMGLPVSKVNCYGGAIAMGHPLGASGARILCTLLSVLQQEGGRYGAAAICNGGGGASAMVLENLKRINDNE